MKKIRFWGLIWFFCRIMTTCAWGQSMEEFHLDHIQTYLDSMENERMKTEGLSITGNLSFEDIVQELMEGNLAALLEQGTQSLIHSFLAEIRTNRELLVQIMILAVMGAVFSNFSGAFGSGHVSEAGFYVVYLVIMTLLSASFYSSVSIAGQITGELARFMQVLLPSYFLAVAASGGILTSAAICGFTIGAIGVVQMVLAEILLPLTRIYMLLVLAGNMIKEEMISKCTELLERVILWTLKTMFGIVVGFHVIQGLIMPQADALKNNAVLQAVRMIPGVGAAVGSVSQMVLGSGVLIRNTIGMAGVIVMILMAVIPLLKLLLLMCFYYLAGAVMQPVCDKRLVSCMTGAAIGHGLLLKIVIYSMALFSVTIAILCVATGNIMQMGG